MTDNVHFELVEWADRFLEAAIWKNISDSDNFCVQHESWKEPAFISIMGNAGIIYGISIWRGVKSYKLLEGLRNSDIELSKTVELSPEEISSLRSLGRNNSTYLISYFVGPFSVQEKMMRVLLVHDRNKDKILSTDPFEATDPFENIIKKLVEVFKGKISLMRHRERF